MDQESSTELPPSPITAALRYWYITVPLAVLGLVVGVLVGSSRPTEVTAEARLAVGSGDLASYQVAGFASAATQLASNYARYAGAQSTPEQRRDLVGDVAGQVDDISASPIPDSNIVRVEVVSTSEAAAVLGADRAADRLVALTTGADPQRDPGKVLADFTAVSQEAAQAEALQEQAKSQLSSLIGQKAAPAVLTQARVALAAATSKLSIAKLRQDALGGLYQELAQSPPTQSGLVVVDRAFVSETNATSQQQLFGVGGLILGALLGLVVAVVLSRRRVVRASAATTSEGRGDLRSADRAELLDDVRR